MSELLILDGAMGTMLQSAGMKTGENSELQSLAHPEWVESIHRSYLEAGSRVIYANTFGANRRKLAKSGHTPDEIIRASIGIAKRVAEPFDAAVALDVGPIGALLEPLGTLTFEEAYDIFAEMVTSGAEAGADLIVIETMTDLYEAKAALLAAKECSKLPVFVTMSFEESGRTFTGCTVASMAHTLEGLGADAVGINCSLGPAELLPLVKELRENTTLPIIVKPNAGLPDPVDGHYDLNASDFAAAVLPLLSAGASIAGGCCGTDPEYLRALCAAADGTGCYERAGFICGDRVFTAVRIQETAASDAFAAGSQGAGSQDTSAACSQETGSPDTSAASPQETDSQDTSAAGSESQGYIPRSFICTPTVPLPIDRIRVIGERINPTGKKRFQQALLENDLDYIVDTAVKQMDAGAEILDVNVGHPGVNEVEMLPRVVKAIQAAVDLPLQLDSSNPAALEAGLRVYNGKAAVNSVNGKEESLEQILPVVKKYGAAVVGLALDEDGLPDTAKKRFEIAQRILTRAIEVGIPKEDVWIDCLTLTVSAQQEQAEETLRAVEMVTRDLGLQTVLGVSNISFGLPMRPLITQTFLIRAMHAGLTLPIVNPNQYEIMDAIYAFRVLNGEDTASAKYIERFAGMVPAARGTAEAASAGAAGAGGTSSAGSSAGAAGAGGASSAGSSASAAGAGGAASAGAGAQAAGHDTPLKTAILRGLKGEAARLARELLKTTSEMDIVEEHLIPALDKVGQDYEKGIVFLPQLLTAAQTAQAVFEEIRASLIEKGEEKVVLGRVIVATVQGDIHDIGKNIVKVMLENYGFDVLDLGRDVAPETVVSAAVRENIRLVGLSALMTTTLPAMEETIRQLQKLDDPPKVMVGGAVVTAEYAKSIGADYYAKDAQESVKIARQVLT